MRILLAEDDPHSAESTRRTLEHLGYQVDRAENGAIALDCLKRPDANYDLLLTDLRMPELTGIELLRAARVVAPELPVVLMTAFGRVQDAVEAMKLGAVDFLMKPYRLKQLEQAVNSSLRVHAERKASRPVALRPQANVVTRLLESQITQVAPTMATVLIRGESGTGKERVARAVHEKSTRRTQAFMALNCAAIPESLIEAELFGFERGSFTGANQARTGVIEAAHKGTLFLDEVGEMPLSAQAKLLRVLQDGEIRRIGATETKHVDVRIVAATHRNLDDLVSKGLFREDLLFRLRVIELKVPALRERLDELPTLASELLSELCVRHGKPTPRLTDGAIRALCRHSWPGNIRELGNALEHALVFCEQEQIDTHHLPAHLLALRADVMLEPERTTELDGELAIKVGTPLRQVEDLLIRRTLEATQGDKAATARLLGIHERTIYRRIKAPDEPCSSE